METVLDGGRASLFSARARMPTHAVATGPRTRARAAAAARRAVAAPPPDLVAMAWVAPLNLGACACSGRTSAGRRAGGWGPASAAACAPPHSWRLCWHPPCPRRPAHARAERPAHRQHDGGAQQGQPAGSQHHRHSAGGRQRAAPPARRRVRPASQQRRRLRLPWGLQPIASAPCPPLSRAHHAPVRAGSGRAVSELAHGLFVHDHPGGGWVVAGGWVGGWVVPPCLAVAPPPAPPLWLASTLAAAQRPGRGGPALRRLPGAPEAGLASHARVGVCSPGPPPPPSTRPGLPPRRATPLQVEDSPAEDMVVHFCKAFEFIDRAIARGGEWGARARGGGGGCFRCQRQGATQSAAAAAAAAAALPRASRPSKHPCSDSSPRQGCSGQGAAPSRTPFFASPSTRPPAHPSTWLACAGNVMVHCAAGVSRSAMLVVGYLMSRHSMAYEDALHHLKEVGACLAAALSSALLSRRTPAARCTSPPLAEAGGEGALPSWCA